MYGTGLFDGGRLTLRLRRTTVRRQAPARQPPTKMLSVSWVFVGGNANAKKRKTHPMGAFDSVAIAVELIVVELDECHGECLLVLHLSGHSSVGELSEQIA